MKQNLLVSNFTGGAFSPRLYGRPDIQKYRNALKECHNFTIVPHGGARKRAGTKFIIEVKDSDDSARLVPFKYNTEQTYMLLFGPLYIWVLKDQGIITQTAQAITDITNDNPGVVTYSGSDTYTNGDVVYITSVGGMHQVNNRHFVVANVDGGANTFELDGVNTTDYGTYTSGGTVGEIVEITTTYAADEIPDLQFTQKADTLYITHPSHAPAKLTRTSHTAWTLADVDLQKGPFRPINGDATIVITPSAGSATAYGTYPVGDTITLTAVGGTPFDADMVGSLFALNESSNGETGIAAAPVGDQTKTIANNDVYTFDGKVYGISNVTGGSDWRHWSRVPRHDSGVVRVIGGTGGTIYFDATYLHDGWTAVRITAFTSTAIVDATVEHNQVPASMIASGTSFWEEGAFSGHRGYPRAVTFFEQRLFFAGTTTDPQTVWGSKTGVYEDFEDGPDDDSAILFSVASGEVDVIRWISGGRSLSCGTSAGEFTLAGSTANDALTPSNVRAVPQTTFGTSSGQPVRIGQVIMFPQRAGDPDVAGKKLREFAYQFDSDAFNSADLSIFSEHITSIGMTQLAYQMEPDSILWAVLSDGTLAALTYERDQQVVAWHTHALGGTNTVVEYAAVIPGNAGDELYLEVARTINGGTKRYIEMLTPPLTDQDDKEDGVYLDCALTYSGVATSTITGLYHLEGATVDVLNYGAVETGKTISNGSITLTNSATLNQPVHIGLPYTSVLETLDLEAGAQAGTAQSRIQRIVKMFVRVWRSLGGTAGPDTSNQDEFLLRDPSDVFGSSPALRSGLYPPDGFDFPGGQERGASIRIEHDEPLPLFITGIVAEVSTAG
jgi:hypothetical protein